MDRRTDGHGASGVGPFGRPGWATLLPLALLVATAWPARGLISFSLGNDPVTDQNWPSGALDLANLQSRVGHWAGPGGRGGGGQSNFVYRGDAKAFQEALDVLAGIRAPKVVLVVHEGPHELWLLKGAKDAKSDARVDWAFSVWDPRAFHRRYNDPLGASAAGDPSGRFGAEVEPPQLDVYVACPDGKGIDFQALRIPAGVTVIDRRATAAGYPAGAGSVVRGAVYDMLTSKPIPGAEVVVEARKENGAGGAGYERVASGKAEEDGLFELKGLPAGACMLTASAPGYVPRLVGYEQLGNNDLVESTIRLAPPVKLSGKVLDGAGKPLAGVKVRAEGVVAIDGRDYSTAGRADATTDAAGVFELADVPVGYCRLDASLEGLQLLDPFKLLSVPAKDLTLRMTGTGTIRGNR